MRRQNLRLVAIPICMMLMVMQVACTHLKPVDTSRVLLTGVNKIYLDTYTMYAGLINDSTIPAQQRATLYKQASKPLDTLKDYLMAVNACQIAWDLSGAKPIDYDAAKARFTAQNTLVKSILANAMTQFNKGGAK